MDYSSTPQRVNAEPAATIRSAERSVQSQDVKCGFSATTPTALVTTATKESPQRNCNRQNFFSEYKEKPTGRRSTCPVPMAFWTLPVRPETPSRLAAWLKLSVYDRRLHGLADRGRYPLARRGNSLKLNCVRLMRPPRSTW